MKTAVLFEEYREGILECVHVGTACVVDRSGVAASEGDLGWRCFYRSASKPLQALPVLTRRLNRKYGLTEEETAIFSGSHWGDEEHVHVLSSILEKTGLFEDQMIMLPTYPLRAARKETLIRRDQPPRKLYHNCSGKHLGLMLLARELGDRVEDYWRRDSRTQREVRRMIALMSDTPEDEISVGVDGCGVPVFAVPFSGIANSYLKLVQPELIRDDAAREAVADNMARLHAHPNMIAGENIVDSIFTKNPDLIGKSGAMGVYAMGIRSMGLGVAVKVMDGSHDEFGAVAIRVLETLKCAPETVKELRKFYPEKIVNDNQEIVGCRKAVFELNVCG